MHQPELSIIVPMRNEAPRLSAILEQLSALQKDPEVEVLLVDGDSTDTSVQLARSAGLEVLACESGRARQMNIGAAHSRGELLMFLHADSKLPDGFPELLLARMARSNRCWGRFDVTLEGRSKLLPIIARFMNWRSRLTGIATGDQGIFVRRSAFERLGGFPDQPLMEDIEISRRLLKHTPPICLRARLTTSGRRWDEQGALRTIWLMWQLRWAYWRGASPTQLSERYL